MNGRFSLLLGEMLIARGKLDVRRLEEALTEQRGNGGRRKAVGGRRKAEGGKRRAQAVRWRVADGQVEVWNTGLAMCPSSFYIGVPSGL